MHHQAPPKPEIKPAWSLFSKPRFILPGKAFLLALYKHWETADRELNGTPRLADRTRGKNSGEPRCVYWSESLPGQLCCWTNISSLHSGETRFEFTGKRAVLMSFHEYCGCFYAALLQGKRGSDIVMKLLHNYSFPLKNDALTTLLFKPFVWL